MIEQILATELGLKRSQIEAVIQLLDSGATVPFIARYRKEATGGIDDTQLRNLVERLQYLRELSQRREMILKTIGEQGRLSDELKKQIFEAKDKTTLEDLYLPYKPKRRTKAQIAREAGLEPLALELLKDPQLDPQSKAVNFINPENNIADVEAALAGAKEILMEIFSEQAELLGELRHYFWQYGVLTRGVY